MLSPSFGPARFLGSDADSGRPRAVSKVYGKLVLAGVAEKTAVDSVEGERRREVPRLREGNPFLPSAGKMRALVAAAVSLGSGNCVRLNTGRSLVSSDEGRVFQSVEEKHVHGVTSFSKLAHGGSEASPSSVTMECMFFWVPLVFKGAMMSRLYHRDFLCAGASLPMRDCLLRPFRV